MTTPTAPANHPNRSLNPATVAHLTSVHPVRDTRILYRECASLAAAGYHVVLVAPHTQDETIAGIRILSVERLRGRCRRVVFTTSAILRKALSARADIYHFHDPELIPTGFILKLLGHAVVYDVHEDAPLQVLSKFWIPRPIRRCISAAIRCAEWVAGRVFDGVVAATPSIAARFPAARTTIVQNFADPSEFAPVDPQPYGGRAKLFAYVGALSEIRGARQMISALRELQDQSIQLVCLGHFQPESLEQDLRSVAGDANVTLAGHASRDQVAALLSRARAGIVVLQPTPNYLESYPVKLFEYMMAALPVVASDFPLWRRIVGEARCGLLVDPRDPTAISRALLWILEHPREAEAMGRRGREVVLRKYNWADQASRLFEVYQQITGRTTGQSLNGMIGCTAIRVN